MPQMEVVAVDTFVSQFPPFAQQTWSWPIAWEYLSLTVIPISSNGNVQITSQWATSDAASNRAVVFNWQNNTGDPLDCFITLTLPASSVD
jgi:hypothetical protein